MTSSTTQFPDHHVGEPPPAALALGREAVEEPHQPGHHQGDADQDGQHRQGAVGQTSMITRTARNAMAAGAGLPALLIATRTG